MIAAAGDDTLLAVLLRVRDGRERDQAIERILVELAQPLIDRILKRSFAPNELASRDREDVAATTRLRLLKKLRMLAAGETAPIAKLEDYIATLAYNSVHDHLRRRYPQLTALKNRLRYVLTRDRRFALWNEGGQLVAGLAEWRGAHAEVLRHPPELPPSFALLDRDRGRALDAVFRAIGAPVLLQALVSLLARLWSVSDSPRLEVVEPVERDSPLVRFEARESLRLLWEEIETLSPNQRKALLLNLRDDETVNVVSIFILAGVVSFDRMAAALEMDGATLEELWNDLPLDDLRIAARLGIARQQVINLRKSARTRLQRRLGRGGKTGQ